MDQDERAVKPQGPEPRVSSIARQAREPDVLLDLVGDSAKAGNCDTARTAARAWLETLGGEE